MTTVELGMPAEGPIADAIAHSVEAHGPKQTELKAKDLKTDQEVRWCPGCGDYVILNAVQSFLPSLGIAREDMVIVSGIGCSSRFPYYLNTYGMHSIHGRAPAIATGLASSRPDLSVWVVTGDGDARVAVIGWGSTYGPIGAACRRIRRSGRSIAQVHLRHLNPMPADLGDILRRYDRVVCPEMNLGQLSLLLRAKYLVDVQSHTQVRGLPFRAAELAAVIQDVIDATSGAPLAADPTGGAE